LNALKTDGSDDYAYPLNPNAAGIPEGTVEIWFSPDNWSSSQQIWGGGNGFPGVNGDWAKLGTHSSVGGSNLAFGRFSGVWRWASSGTQPSPGAWYHVAATWGPAGLKIYLNGILAGQNSFSGDLNSYTTELIAASAWGVTFSGAIDELRIWNIPLDSTAISRNLLDTLDAEYYTTADSGLIAYYRMDEFEDLGINGDGADDIRDLSVNANHLDTEGNPTMEPSGAFVITGIKDRTVEVPDRYELSQNYPNPFNPGTTIRFTLPEAAKVQLDIFNILGQRVATPANGRYAAGYHTVNFDGRGLASGVYFYQLKADGFVQMHKMLLMK
jgi:hypothetical protein